MKSELYNRNRVVVTGMGSFSPSGTGVSELWDAVLEGRSVGKVLNQFSEHWPTRVGCEFSQAQKNQLSEKYGDCSKITGFGLIAVDEAIKDAKLGSYLNSLKCGVSVGTGLGGKSITDLIKDFRGCEFDSDYSNLLEVLLSTNHQRMYNIEHPSTLSYEIARRYGFKDRVITYQSACAASSQAIGDGFQAIRSGQLDIALVGGSDSVSSEFIFCGFSLLGVMTKNNKNPSVASRPFDNKRDGFLASEGASFLVLESLESALNRGVNIYAEVLGYGQSQNAYRITDLREDGAGTIYAMKKALSDASISSNSIRLINAHGTSTLQNDRIEAKCIEDVFGKNSNNLAVSATKSVTGHLVAASGAIEALLTVKSIFHKKIPGNYNFEGGDWDYKFQLPTETMDSSIGYAMSNSFGFGGTNVSLVFGEVGK